MARRPGHGQRHAVPCRLDRHPGGGAHPVQRGADHAERRRGRQPRRRTRGGRQPDARGAPPRILVVYARGAEPGRARPARRRRRRLRGRSPVGRAAPSGQPARLLRHAARRRCRHRPAVRLQLRWRCPHADRDARRRRGAAGLRRPHRVGIDHKGRLDAGGLRRQPVRRVRGDRRACPVRLLVGPGSPPPSRARAARRLMATASVPE